MMPGPGDRSRTHLTLIGQQSGVTGRAARASKYDARYGPAIRLLTQQGQWPEEWACACGVTVRTLNNWATSYPEFHEHLSMAYHQLAAFWAADMRENRMNPRYGVRLVQWTLERRLKEFYGGEAVSVAELLGLRIGEAGDTDHAPDQPLTPEQWARRMSTEELVASLTRQDEERRIIKEESEKNGR